MLDAAVLANPSAQALVLHRKIITLEAEIQGFYDVSSNLLPVPLDLNTLCFL